MSGFDSFLQQFVNLSYDELLTVANLRLTDLDAALRKFFGKHSDVPTKAFLMLIATCLGADCIITPLEHRFVNELLGSDYDEETLLAVVSSLATSETYTLVDDLTDTLDESARSSLITLALCFLSVDKAITRSEVAFLRRLIE